MLKKISILLLSFLFIVINMSAAEAEFEVLDGVNCWYGDPMFPVVWENAVAYDVVDRGSAYYRGNKANVLVTSVSKKDEAILLQRTLHFVNSGKEGLRYYWDDFDAIILPVAKDTEPMRVYQALSWKYEPPVPPVKPKETAEEQTANENQEKPENEAGQGDS